MSFSWADENVEKLKALHAKGLSFYLIAQQIGCISRNAAIGKAKRLGLPSREKSAPSIKRPRKPYCGARRNGNGFVRVNPAPDDTPPPPDFSSLSEVESQPVPSTFLAIKFVDLEAKHCRYPRTIEGVHLFCGQPHIEGSSYCADCHARCWHSGRTLDISDEERDRRRKQALIKRAEATSRAAGGCMKAWSLWQPWASLWLSPCKLHETRSWPLMHRGPLLVHATKHIEFESLTDELEAILDSEFGGHWGMDLPRGALIGAVEIVSCRPVADALHSGDLSSDDIACGDWSEGRYAIERSPEFKKFKAPIPYRGRQRNPFDVPDELVREALAA